ncbi:MAG: thiamine-phosphate kinase [Gemmatimonadota bacterium]
MTAEFGRIDVFVGVANAGRDAPETGGGPGDDAAVLSVPPGERLVVSSDQTVEGIHFERAWLTWEQIGYRAAATAFSDLAAMAAAPLGCLISLSLPPELDGRVLEELAAGVRECLDALDTRLLGGDLSASQHGVFMDVTVLGHAARPVLRSGAEAGDELWLTGSVGGAGAAIEARQHGLEPDPAARQAFERPQPRIQLARWLAEQAAVHAMIDLSDGLAGDARHVSAASGVQLRFQLASLPLAEPLAQYADREAAWRMAISGGEDYELLVVAAPGTVEPLRQEALRKHGVSLTRVGEVRSLRMESGANDASLVWLTGEGLEWDAPAAGYEHFRAE